MNKQHDDTPRAQSRHELDLVGGARVMVYGPQRHHEPFNTQPDPLG